MLAVDCILALRRDERPQREDDLDRAWVGAALLADGLRKL